VQRVNLLAPVFDDGQDRPGFSWRAAGVGRQLGAARIGGCLYELPDGELTFPYHIHHGSEEWALVVAGTPVLRGPEGDRELRAGDLVCFPAGPEGAHQFRGPGTVLIVSSNRLPETTEYPDSGKLGAKPPRSYYRRADAVDYWDGE
jgi:uncharacterized cupin superfamily protein